jgi:two-component system, LytTR family, response regulator
MIRALIVDDEAPARKRLRDLLAEVGDVTVVGECVDGPEAVAVIEKERPDLVFLDVQMPEMDGFEVLEAVGPDAIPAVIFVTAYDQHAVAAFDARALDYLLKPYSQERFLRTLHRVREALVDAQESLVERVESLLDQRGASSRIPVREEGRIRFVEVDSIDWLEADGNYVVLHAGGERHRIRATLKRMAGRLAGSGFIRIHQSYVVNSKRIRELQPWSHGEFAVVMEDGTTLVSSRTYSGALRELLDV